MVTVVPATVVPVPFRKTVDEEGTKYEVLLPLPRLTVTVNVLFNVPLPGIRVTVAVAPSLMPDNVPPAMLKVRVAGVVPEDGETASHPVLEAVVVS
jgi:hypothetical protein